MNYDNPEHRTYPRHSDSARFVEEVETAGFEWEHYKGYSFYEGPGVRVDEDSELVDLIRVTTVNVRWDSLGSGYIVYPLFGNKGE